MSRSSPEAAATRSSWRTADVISPALSANRDAAAPIAWSSSTPSPRTASSRVQWSRRARQREIGYLRPMDGDRQRPRLPGTGRARERDGRRPVHRHAELPGPGSVEHGVGVSDQDGDAEQPPLPHGRRDGGRELRRLGRGLRCVELDERRAQCGGRIVRELHRGCTLGPLEMDEESGPLGRDVVSDDPGQLGAQLAVVIARGGAGSCRHQLCTSGEVPVERARAEEVVDDPVVHPEERGERGRSRRAVGVGNAMEDREAVERGVGGEQRSHAPAPLPVTVEQLQDEVDARPACG